MCRLGGLIEHDLPIAIGQRGQTRSEFRLIHSSAQPAVRAVVQRKHPQSLGQLLPLRKSDRNAKTHGERRSISQVLSLRR